MKNMFKKMFSRSGRDEMVSNMRDTQKAQITQIRQKKEKVIDDVGERYGRAITRLSDT